MSDESEPQALTPEARSQMLAESIGAEFSGTALYKAILRGESEGFVDPVNPKQPTDENNHHD